MRHIFIVLVTLCAMAGNALAQSVKENDITGKWLTEDKTGWIQVYKSGNKLFGRIEGGTSVEKFDVHNPDPARRKDSLVGLVILKDFVYKGDGVWKEGTIYDPKNGKTYSCNLTLLNQQTLKIRGYIGFSWIGRTEIWTRIKQ